jgi:23S rRNA pseudouridine1911/1915/1917 synthase
MASQKPMPDIDNEEGSEELYERMNLTIDKGQEPMRLDKFLVARIEGASRNKIQQAIEAGRVLINGKQVQANHKIKPGEELVVYSDKEVHGEEIVPQQMPLNIVFEDEDILIINKPVGLVVHPASGNPDKTLVNGVAWYLQQQNKDITAETLLVLD